MKARFTFSSRAGLINAVTCLILTPTIGLLHDTSTASAQTKQAGSADTADRQVKSAVQRQVDAMFARDGQKAPNLSSKDAVRHLSKSVPPSRLGTVESASKVQSRKTSPLRSLLPTRLPRLPKLTGFRSKTSKTKATTKSVPSKSTIVQASKQEKTKKSTSSSQPEAVQKTEVQRHLEDLYRRDGRTAPEMKIPASRTAPKTTTRKPSFLSRFFRIGRKSKSANRKEKTTPQKSAKISDSKPRVLPNKIHGEKPTSALVQKPQPKQTDSKVRTAAKAVPSDPPTVKPAEATKDVKPTKEKQTKKTLDPFAEIAKDQSEKTLPSVSPKDADSKAVPRPAARLLPNDDDLIKKAINDAEQLPSVEPVQSKSTDTAKTDEKKASGDLPKIDPADVPKTDNSKSAGSAHANKFKKIVERKGNGLKGFCVVTLRDQRELRDSDAQFKSKFEDVEYHFSSAKAKATFDKSPTEYAPIVGGIDVVQLINNSKEEQGKLDHAVWYKDRLYLFSSRTNLEEFVISPGKYAQVDKD